MAAAGEVDAGGEGTADRAVVIDGGDCAFNSGG